MSGDGNGQKPDGRVRAKLPSVLLALTGIAIVAIQTYVFISFDQFKSSYGPFTLYNGVAMASGAVSCLTGFIGFACTSKKRSSSGFCFSALMSVLAAVCSAGSAAMTAIESSKINANDSDHPCALLSLDDQPIDCNLWFDLEVAVAALSVLAFILSVTLFIVIVMAGSSKSKKTIERSNVERPAEIVREMEHIPAAQPVVVMPVIVEEVYKEAMEVEEPEVEEPEEESNTMAGRQPYIEQLRMLSREELERRLGEHMQHQFLEELRTELNRRNLIPINGRSGSGRSGSGSSVRSSNSKVPVAPRPDYYQEETL